MFDDELRRVGLGAAVLIHSAGCAVDLCLREDLEGGVAGAAGGSEACRVEDGFEFSGADDGVYFGDILLDFVAVALDEAAGDDEPLRFAAVLLFVLNHLEDGVDGLLLGGVDEAACVDDDDLGVFCAGGELGPVVVEQAHHDLGVNEVLGAAERDEADLWTFEGTRCGFGWGGLGDIQDAGDFGCCGRGHRVLF